MTAVWAVKISAPFPDTLYSQHPGRTVEEPNMRIEWIHLPKATVNINYLGRSI